MEELRAAQDSIAAAYLGRDRRIAEAVLRRRLSREDVSLATGLSRPRIDQIVREASLGYPEGIRDRQ